MERRHQTQPRLSDPIESGAWAGWSRWTGEEPFEDAIGPFYAKRDSNGSMIAGCRLNAKSLRSGGIAHGGMLMSFADFASFIICHDEFSIQDGVTASMTSLFLAAAPTEALLIGRGEVLKRGKSLVFVRGLVSANEIDVLEFSGVIKLVKLHLN